jgi:hypothetical protein
VGAQESEVTTKKCIEMMQAADPEGTRQVYLQRDSEGNGYEPARTTWCGGVDKHGDVGLDHLTEADRALEYTEEDVKKGKRILVIAP